MPSFVLIDKFQVKAKICCGDVFDIKIGGFAGAIGFYHDGPVFDARDNLLAMGIININDGAAALYQQRLQQPQFCGKIVIHIYMMIKMVTAKIGKAGHMDV